MNVKGDSDNCQEEDEVEELQIFFSVSKFNFLWLITQLLSFVCLFVCLFVFCLFVCSFVCLFFPLNSVID